MVAVTKLKGAAMNNEWRVGGVQALYELPDDKVTPEEVSALADQVFHGGYLPAHHSKQCLQGKGMRWVLGPAAVRAQRSGSRSMSVLALESNHPSSNAVF